jgi:hypothetical protein
MGLMPRERKRPQIFFKNEFSLEFLDGGGRNSPWRAHHLGMINGWRV